MKKVVIILTVMFMLTGCDKTSYNYQDEISKYTEEVMLERDNLTYTDATREEKVEIPTEESTESIPIISSDKSEIDKDNIDYKIHLGRIDCLNTSDCFLKSSEIEKELTSSILDIVYLDVKNKNNETLGYFINYIFKDYQYEDYETCMSKGEYLKQRLSDRNVDYQCDDSVLKITLDKKEDSND